MQNVASPISANQAEAVRFLSAIAGGGRVAVASIVPDGPIKSAVFHSTAQSGELAAWLETWRGVANLYYSLNEPRPGATGRLKEADVSALRGVAVDLDPRRAEEALPGGYERERARLLKVAAEWADHFFAPPSAIVDSGGGLQMCWLFPEPLPNDEATRANVKAHAKAIGALLGSDAVQSVDHLFRIPFTENLPTAKKAARGRVRQTARLVRRNKGATATLTALSMIASPASPAPAAEPASGAFDYGAVLSSAGDCSALPAHLATVADKVSQNPAAQTALASEDRSACDFALACLAVEAGLVEASDVAQVTFALSDAKLLEKDRQGYGESYAASTVRRALERTKPKPVAERWFDGAPINLPVSLGALRVVTGVVNAKALPVRRWLVQPRLPIGDVFQLVGEPGVSKSTFALRDALSVATGRESLLRGLDLAGGPISSERLHQSGAVIVYNAEDRADEMEKRLAAAQRHHGVTGADMRHPIILWSGVDHSTLKIVQRARDRSPLRRAPGADALESLIQAHKAVLAILDPQISLTAGGFENDNDDADALMQELAIMASRNSCCIAVVHHTAKTTRDKAGDMGAGRGGFAAVGKVRSACTLVRVTGRGEGEEAWGVGSDESFIRLDYAKVSHDRKPTKPIVFRRIEAPVGNGAGQNAEELFSGSPRERLESGGDTAPVLEVVDIEARASAARGASGAKADAAAERVARVVDTVLGEEPSAAWGAIYERLGSRLRAEGLTTAKGRDALRVLVIDALEQGVSFDRDGQTVRIEAVQTKQGDRAPWTIRRTVTAAQPVPT